MRKTIVSWGRRSAQERKRRCTFLSSLVIFHSFFVRKWCAIINTNVEDEWMLTLQNLIFMISWSHRFFLVFCLRIVIVTSSHRIDFDRKILAKHLNVRTFFCKYFVSTKQSSVHEPIRHLHDSLIITTVLFIHDNIYHAKLTIVNIL